MDIKITWYEDWMLPQIVEMFEEEYKTKPGYFISFFKKFYNHPFQQNKRILIVALDGEKVAGFQSFFYWPYRNNVKTFNSYQSGNSLIHPSYRGKGIFNKMLEFIDRENKTIGVDFLMGFPVQASLKNFLKDKWNNILNLRWFVAVCNPFGFFSGGLKNNKKFERGCVYFDSESDSSAQFRLSGDPAFSEWRTSCLVTELYFSFAYRNANKEIIFHLKMNKRKKFLNELVIGNIILKNRESAQDINTAVKKLKTIARGSFGVHFLSIALNEKGSPELVKGLESCGFKSTDKTIYFITKPFAYAEEVNDPANWILFRSDIDTW